MGSILCIRKQSKLLPLNDSISKGDWQVNMAKVSNFLKGVNHEIKETTWPTAKEMRKNTVAVFTIIILFALFFFVTESVIVRLLPFI